METESNFLRHEPCPECGSKDNLARYDDGHGHCFGCGHYEHADGTVTTKRVSKVAGLIDLGEVVPLTKRKITKETCEKFRYTVSKFKNKTCQVANYFKDGQVIAQKLRFANKDFTFTGKPKEAPLYGQWLWRDTGRMVVVTEGEIDCLTVSQLQGNKWPVVSVQNGAQGAAKSVAKAIGWLEAFEKVVFMFDMDEPGQTAARECAALLTPGKAYIASLPMKDPNEMLVAGRGKEVIDAIWSAKVQRPDGVVGVMDCIDEAMKLPEMGVEWPWPSLTELTYGIHSKTVYYLGAGVGIGKTDWAKELQSHLVNKIGAKVGVFMLEETNARTLKGIAGKFVGKPFHVPNGDFTQEELEAAVRDLDGKVYLYKHDGEKDWDVIKSAIKYMVVGCGVKYIFLDNLTAMVAHLTASEANDEINRIAKELSDLVHRYDFTVFGFSHLNAPKTGESHERGGAVHESQFTGSRGLMRFGNYLFGLQRNKDPMISDTERNTTTFVLLKDREFGNNGSFKIFYDKQKGTFLEPPEDFGFDDEQQTEDEGYGF